jgi:hypothetical protein
MGIPPNKIKYTTTPVTNAVKAKNFAVGINSSFAYGPTSSTGYWNGITPLINGFTIYVRKDVQGPSIFRPSNDSEFLNITNYLSGNNFSTTTQATAWYSSQSDIICVNKDYPDIVTNGLQIMVDSGFLPSYSRSGNTWTDLSYSGKNATLINSPTFILSGDGFLNFQSSSSNYATFSDLGNLSNFSCEVWTKQNSVPSSGSYPTFITNTFPGPNGNLVNYSIGYNKAPWDGKIYGGFFNGSWQLNIENGYNTNTTLVVIIEIRILNPFHNTIIFA